ncbi:hypothetical protein A2U01_0026424, partial [Trifolium medium]|nr:hypothetical protein [Trifolium medium]
SNETSTMWKICKWVKSFDRSHNGKPRHVLKRPSSEHHMVLDSMECLSKFFVHYNVDGQPISSPEVVIDVTDATPLPPRSPKMLDSLYTNVEVSQEVEVDDGDIPPIVTSFKTGPYENNGQKSPKGTIVLARREEALSCEKLEWTIVLADKKHAHEEPAQLKEQVAQLGVANDEIKSSLHKEEVKTTKEEKHNSLNKIEEVEGKLNKIKRFEEVVKDMDALSVKQRKNVNDLCTTQSNIVGIIRREMLF